MFKIEGDIIHINRGDKAIIEFSIDNYTFQVDDVIRFAVYKEKKMSEEPIFEKIIINKSEGNSIEIVINSKDTQLVNLLDQPLKCWYEIELNDEQTILGYDENGPKVFIIYPEGADADATS